MTVQFAIENLAGYRFVQLDNLAARKADWDAAVRGTGLRGTILLSPEGINFSVAGDQRATAIFRTHLDRDPLTRGIAMHSTRSEERPFKRLSIKVKPDVIPSMNVGPMQLDFDFSSDKITPERLKDWLDRRVPLILLDVRNTYECRVGAFAGAIHLGLEGFRDFAAKAREWTVASEGSEKPSPGSNRELPLVTYCTGGIRCEKAAPYLRGLGWRDVWQLDGGILRYLKEFGGQHFQGDCFVFDDRVALNQRLLPRGTIPCENCDAPLIPQDQLAPEFVPGASCPYCFEPGERTQRSGTSGIAERNLRLRLVTSPLPGSAAYDNQRRIDVRGKYAGYEAWKMLELAFPLAGREAWRERLDGRFLWRGDEPVAFDTILREGDVLIHRFPDTVEPNVNPQVQVLHEDTAIVVVDKGAPLPVHACGRFNRNTLLFFLNQVYAPQRLRLAHRIDANTSGLVVLTRSLRFARILQPQFEHRRVEKTYLARVLGHPPEAVFQSVACLGPESLPGGARKVEAIGTAAETHFRCLGTLDEHTSLIEVRPITGRTNQIRVHLWDLGWPILGDPMYLAERQIGDKQTLDPTDHPLCLHAWKLAFDHPLHHQRVEFEAVRPAWCQADWRWSQPEGSTH